MCGPLIRSAPRACWQGWQDIWIPSQNLGCAPLSFSRQVYKRFIAWQLFISQRNSCNMRNPLVSFRYRAENGSFSVLYGIQTEKLKPNDWSSGSINIRRRRSILPEYMIKDNRSLLLDEWVPRKAGCFIPKVVVYNIWCENENGKELKGSTKNYKAGTS